MGLKSPSSNPGLFSHEFLNHGIKKFMVEKVKGHFNHELFNPMIQNSMVQKSGVEKFMVEKSGVEAWV